jgi:hypothetical protein
MDTFTAFFLPALSVIGLILSPPSPELVTPEAVLLDVPVVGCERLRVLLAPILLALAAQQRHERGLHDRGQGLPGLLEQSLVD